MGVVIRFSVKIKKNFENIIRNFWKILKKQFFFMYKVLSKCKRNFYKEISLKYEIDFGKTTRNFCKN